MSESARRCQLYDTTLRDGAQGEGVSFSLDDKVKIAEALAATGVDFIEAGYASSSAEDVEVFRKLTSMKFGKTKIVAFGSTRKKGVAPESDAGLRAILDSGAKTATIFGKSWTLHVDNVLGTTPEKNLEMISDSVSFLKRRRLEVLFDAEHFFDGYAEDSRYALQVLDSARDAGASALVLCDTNGGSFPKQVEKVTSKVVSRFGGCVGIHAHNDTECAVANSLAAVHAGAMHVQGTINGYGERVGNANLISLIVGLHKLGFETIGKAKMTGLTELSKYVARVVNEKHNPRLPYVGDRAFAHKAGTHIDAILKMPDAYEHMKPELVGNKRRTLASKQSGKAAILDKAREYGFKLDDEKLVLLTKLVKDLERQGYEFESADASLYLRMAETLGLYSPPFTVNNYVATDNSNKYQSVGMEVQVGGEVVLTTAESRKGLVDAVRKALDKALAGKFSNVSKIVLEDFRVMDLDTERSTEARVGVWITSRCDSTTFGTIGVSSNMLRASLDAIEDSKKYGLLLLSGKARRSK
jgi:2-isopropylmalate synthase